MNRHLNAGGARPHPVGARAGGTLTREIATMLCRATGRIDLASTWFLAAANAANANPTQTLSIVDFARDPTIPNAPGRACATQAQARRFERQDVAYSGPHARHRWVSHMSQRTADAVIKANAQGDQAKDEADCGRHAGAGTA